MRRDSLRRALVRAAGISKCRPGLRHFFAGRAVEVEACNIELLKQLGAYSWGDAPAVKTRLVSVPRSLRRHFGRYVEELA